MIMHVRLDRLAFSLNRELEGRDAHARMNKEGIIANVRRNASSGGRRNCRRRGACSFFIDVARVIVQLTSGMVW
jgi:hypothetical protein